MGCKICQGYQAAVPIALVLGKSRMNVPPICNSNHARLFPLRYATSSTSQWVLLISRCNAHGLQSGLILHIACNSNDLTMRSTASHVANQTPPMFESMTDLSFSLPSTTYQTLIQEYVFRASANLSPNPNYACRG